MELCAWIREQKEARSWKDLFHSFEITADTLKKYQGGTAALVALDAQKMLARMGYKGEVIGESDLLPEICYYPAPSLGNLQVWQAAKNLLQGYSNLLCLLPFKNMDQEKMVLVLRHYFTTMEYVKVYSWTAWEQEFTTSNIKPMRSFKRAQDYIKSILQITFVFQAFSKEKNEKCTLNLLEGTLSVEPGNLPDLPKNLNNKALFSIENLLHAPEKTIQVFLNGETVAQTNRKVLDRYLRAIQIGFGFPKDFQENLLFLIKNKEHFLSEIALPPAAALFSLWPLYKQIDHLRKQAHWIISDDLKAANPSLANFLSQADATYAKALEVLPNANLKEMQETFLLAQQQYEMAMNYAAGQQHMPLSVLLEATNFEVL